MAVGRLSEVIKGDHQSSLALLTTESDDSSKKFCFQPPLRKSEQKFSLSSIEAFIESLQTLDCSAPTLVIPGKICWDIGEADLSLKIPHVH